jgi:hypothetical protein
MKSCPHCAARSMPLLAALRSNKRSPVRCARCHELSYQPPVATLLTGSALELLLMAALLLSGWLSGISVLYAACALTVVLIGGTATLWPLRPVPPRGDKVSFCRPSPFHPGSS